MRGASRTGMATRMTSLLPGSDHATNGASATGVPAGEDQVAFADTEAISVVVRPIGLRTPSFPALPTMMTGLVSTATVWLGLALVVIAVAYPLSVLGRAALSLIGTSMIGIVVAFALASRPEHA
jgi:hypothetical protein